MPGGRRGGGEGLRSRVGGAEQTCGGEHSAGRGLCAQSCPGPRAWCRMGRCEGVGRVAGEAHDA